MPLSIKIAAVLGASAFLAAIGCAFGSPTPACDLSPTPVGCWGQRLLTTTYAGAAEVVQSPTTNTSLSIGFKSDRTLDTASLDALLGGNPGNVTTWKGQLNGCDFKSPALIPLSATLTPNSPSVAVPTAGLTAPMLVMGPNIPLGTTVTSIVDSGHLFINAIPTISSPTNVTLTFTQAPQIESINVGNARAISFQGDNLSGSIFSLASCNMTALGATAKDFSIMMAVQPHSGIYTNQANAPGINLKGAFFDVQGSGGTVVQAYSNPFNASTGAIEVTDGNGADFIPTQSLVLSNPTIITITSDSTGVRVYQNGQVRAVGSRSSLTRTWQTMTLGQLASSVAGATSSAMGYRIVALIVWAQGLHDYQVAAATASLLSSFQIDPSPANYHVNFVALAGDSIPSGYLAPGLYSMGQFLAQLTTYPIRLGMYAVPGSTVTDNGSTSHTTALYTSAISPQCSGKGDRTTLSKILIVLAGGNDALITTVPGGRFGSTQSGSGTILLSNTSSINVGDFVYADGLTQLATVGSISTNVSITLAGGVTVGLTENPNLIQFTNAATSPTAVATALAGMYDQAVSDGCTASLSTVLPRNVTQQTFISALNTQIRAFSPGRNVCDLAADSQLSVNPGPLYADVDHLTLAGQQRAAQVWAACVNPMLTAP